MKEIRNELHRYLRYFEGYQDQIPVIYSTLEGQYQGEIYCDEEEEIVVLVTQFDFIFLGGNIESIRAEDIIEDIIFNELVQKQQRKEIIIFGQNEKWNDILDKVFRKHHGVSDLRKCYHLDLDKFQRSSREVIPTIARVAVKNEQENGSSIEYPVARVYVDDKCVSFCSASMLARGYADIEVSTEEAFRQKGYAKIAAIALMEELLHQGIEPNWCTWPYRIESQALAQSIGFALEKEIPAFIWEEEFGF